MAGLLAEFVPLVGTDMGLAENAALGAGGNLGFPWHNGGIDNLARTSYELDVAALLAGLDKTGRLKTPLDLAEGLGTKPPQPQPRSCGPQAAASPAAVRSAAQPLP